MFSLGATCSYIVATAKLKGYLTQLHVVADMVSYWRTKQARLLCGTVLNYSRTEKLIAGMSVCIQFKQNTGKLWTELSC